MILETTGHRHKVSVAGGGDRDASLLGGDIVHLGGQFAGQRI